MKILFEELLKPKLNRSRGSGGTYWDELSRLIERYDSRGSDWLACSMNDIPKIRQLDKYEPVITYYVTAALALASSHFADTGMLRQLMRKAYQSSGAAEEATNVWSRWKWDGLQFEARVNPPVELRQKVAAHVDAYPVKYIREVAAGKQGVQYEAATHFDIFVGDPQALPNGQGHAALGVEAKFTSDISPSTTYSTHRNQIIRNVEVGNATFTDFLFLLITPRIYRQKMSRLYVYKMNEYIGPGGVAALQRDATMDPGEETAARWRQRMGWLDWEDIVEAVFPDEKPVFDRTDSELLMQVLKDRLLWPQS